MDEFVNTFAERNSARVAKLRGWIAHHGLEGRFRPRHQDVALPSTAAHANDNVLGAGVDLRLTKAVILIHQSLLVERFTCYFVKPNQRQIRQLQISRMNVRMDYCVLDIVKGEANLPGYLDTSTLPLQPGK